MVRRPRRASAGQERLGPPDRVRGTLPQPAAAAGAPSTSVPDPAGSTSAPEARRARWPAPRRGAPPGSALTAGRVGRGVATAKMSSAAVHRRPGSTGGSTTPRNAELTLELLAVAPAAYGDSPIPDLDRRLPRRSRRRYRWPPGEQGGSFFMTIVTLNPASAPRFRGRRRAVSAGPDAFAGDEQGSGRTVAQRPASPFRVGPRNEFTAPVDGSMRNGRSERAVCSW